MTYPQDPNNPYGQQPQSGGYQQPGYGQQYPSGGFPQYPPQYPGGVQGPPPEGPGLAIGGLICSILGIFLCILVTIAGVVMGHIALAKAKRGEAEGQGVALAAVIVGYVGIGLNVLAVILLFGFGYAHELFR